MEQEQYESPAMSFDPIHTDGLSLVACPYLGLENDPTTTLAFPHQSNFCHRRGNPVGIELAYQGGYCLSGNHAGCEVYGQPDEEVPPEEPQVERRVPDLPAVTLPSLDDLPSLQPYLESMILRGQSFRLSLLLFRLRLRSRMPQMPARDEILPKLRQNLPTFDQTRQLLEGKTQTEIPGTGFLKQVDVRLFAIPLMLLLILAAAIIWWPPPGESEQDAIVAGAPIVKETPDTVGDQVQTSALVGQDEAQVGSSAADDKPAQTVPGNEDRSLEKREESISSLSVTDTTGINLPSDETGSIAQPELDVVEDEAQTGARQFEAENEDLNLLVEVPDTENVDVADTDATEAASADVVEMAGLPPAVITSIGPSGSMQDVRSIYESSGPLFLHAAPAGDTAVVALITERQTASILGRDSSGEWILVRLNGGIEGWAKTELSGADILVSNLPAVDDGVEAPETENSLSAEPAVATAVVNIGALNLRAGPGIEFDAIGIVYNKEEVALLDPPGSNGWVQVRLTDGQSGWLNSKYLILPG